MSISSEITRLQTAKADLATAIEGKGVTVPSATKLDGYADLVDAIQTGGGEYSVDDLASRNYNQSNITLTVNRVNAYAFDGANISGTVTAPNVTIIDQSAFKNTKITRAYFPLVAINDIRDNAFENTLLTQIAATDFPKVNSCRQAAFRSCQQLVSVVFPSFNGSNGNNVFNNCKNLAVVRIPTSVKSIAKTAFYNTSWDMTIYASKQSFALAFAKKNYYKYRVV
jgi:hypothetical protein